MMNKSYLILLGAFGVGDLAAAGAVQPVLNANAQLGERLWKSEHTPMRGGQLRSCTTCHGNDLRKPGKHARKGNCPHGRERKQ